MATLVGQTIGQYQIVEHLGGGGMADVYKAFHSGLAVYRAIKVIRPEFVTDADFKARFQREAQAVAEMRHPNIVQVHDFGIQDNLYYMVMEFIEGRDLKQHLTRQGQIRPFSQVLPIIEQVASALSYAHKRGVIHRDIKPANIMLAKDEQVILTDFGIAKILTKQEEAMTQKGVGIGTPAYMAPEQARGASDIGPTADLYSLGIVLYEMLTGRVPYSADTPLAVILKVVNDPLPPPRQFSPDIPDVLQGVVLKATVKDPARRYQSAEAFVDGLKRSLRGESATAPDIAAPTVKEVAAESPPKSQPEKGKKAGWLLGGAAGLAALLLCVLLAAGAGIYFWLRPQPTLATWQFVIDASAGMNETIDGKTKIDIARDALARELDILPGNVGAGLRVFGGNSSGQDPCQDTQLLVEPATGRSRQIAGALAGVSPQGEAPLTEAIVQAIGDFDLSNQNKNTLIIITAGLDTCEADAVSQLETLSRRLGIEFDLHLIGLGVEDPAEAGQLQQLAESAGGSYYNADSEEDIGRVLEDQISILQGTPVARATATPAPTSAPLPPTDTPAPTAPALSLTGPFNLTDTPDHASSEGRIMIDGQGYLHFVWVDQGARELGSDLLHRYKSPDDDWSDPEILTTDFKSLIQSSARLARSPNGQVCAFVAAAGPSDFAQQLYSSCFEGSATTEMAFVQEQWRDADPAFTPDGAPQTVWNQPPGSLYFGETELVSGSAALVYQPTFTIDTAGTFHAAWVRQSDPFRLEYFSSSDGGQSWSEVERLTGDEDPSPGWPRLVADAQGNVHLGWMGFGGKNFYRRWTPDGGWGDAVEIGPDTQGSAWFDLAIDDDGLAHMVWIWTSLYYARQQPDGSWTEPQVILEDAGDANGGGPVMAIDDQGARHIVWHGTDKEIYYATLPRQ